MVSRVEVELQLIDLPLEVYVDRTELTAVHWADRHSCSTRNQWMIALILNESTGAQ